MSKPKTVLYTHIKLITNWHYKNLLPIRKTDLIYKADE